MKRLIVFSLLFSSLALLSLNANAQTHNLQITPTVEFRVLQEHKTSKGVIFKKVIHHSLGEGWLDPQGVIWGGIHGDLSSSDIPEMKEACAKVGGKLPTWNELFSFLKFFEPNQKGDLSREAIAELEIIFPKISKGQHWFWILREQNKSEMITEAVFLIRIVKEGYYDLIFPGGSLPHYFRCIVDTRKT